MSSDAPVIGVIGGSGISRLAGGDVVTSHAVATPWGAPSAAIEERALGGVRLLFLPRHGTGHTIPPHRVNYRANIDALLSLGAQRIVAINSVGSLKEDLPPGTFVLPDQFIDFTKGRPTTFFDGGRVYHLSLADPFCPDLTRRVAEAGSQSGSPFVRGKTYVCVEGPRFSTRAESKFFRGIADVIGMTLVPEVTLARERAMCYVCLAMVTDFDVWAERPVEMTDIVRVMGENTSRMQRVLGELYGLLAPPRECGCAKSLENAGV
ncbi:MAG TPA: S-methyl-5'-thioadenosine phosphorylase [Thermoplasmata archaeon]|nr:S-methyl-5'-thioadenosine phosphorylase [Thermoplasmata archaeon]